MGLLQSLKSAEPRLYFITGYSKGFKPVFASQNILETAENMVLEMIASKSLDLLGYVMIPSHVHLLIGFKGGDRHFKEFLKSFKKLTEGRSFPSAGSVKMSKFDHQLIKDEAQFKAQLKYIHDNPVQKGIAKTATEWKYSSARFWLLDEPHPKLTKEWKWMKS